MGKLLTPGKVAALAAVTLIVNGPAKAAGPPIRSTFYDGSVNAYSAFASQPQFDSSVSMTIEAWVYRWDDTRCETIAGHDYLTSWWLGFCPRLRFYRSGGKQATCASATPKDQWTHVAVTYDGATCHFYINGGDAGSAPLTNAGAGANRPLVIGANPSTTPNVYNYPLEGYVDELRIWSTVRTQQEISDNRYKEIRSAPGLMATFSTGGKVEDLSGATATQGSGITENIFGILPRDLVVPRAAVRPTVNGQLNLDSEYLGAEELVMPYNAGPDEPDLVAFLVYDDTPPAGLFVALGQPRHNTGDWPYSNTSVGVMMDPTFSRSALTESSDFYLSTTLGDYNPTGTWLNGNGAGGFTQCLTQGGQPCTPPSEYAVGKALCGFEIGGLPCAEFFIPKSKLGSWDEFDGLAVIHKGWNSLGAFNIAPGDAIPPYPYTWAKVSYSEGSAELPSAVVSGKVHAGLSASSPGLPNWRVTMSAGGTAYQTYTDSNGNFSFDEVVAANQTVQVQADNCGFCRYSSPTFSGYGTTGSIISDLVVHYPGCASGTCSYKNVDFYIQQTVGPVSVTGVDVASPTPKVVLRDNPTLVSQNTPSIVKISGSNFHDLVEVYLSPVDETLVCPCPDDWVLYKANVISRAADGSWIKVETPTIPGRVSLRKNGPSGNPFGAGYRWVIYDPWTRPNVVTYNLWPNPHANPNSFSLTEPEYPYIWGFGFENRYDDPGWQEFSAVYGTNAYWCVGAGGYCATYVMDPAYALFFPIYYLVGRAMTGSCGGMSSTSLMFKEGLLDAQQFDPNVYFPAGFDQNWQTYKTTWSEGDLAVAVEPASPTNLWARIRVGQMTQVSNETLTHLLSQVCLQADWNPFCGNPADRFAELSPNPLGYITAMIGSFSIAHCVTPYAISGNDIKVYDNNYPYAPAAITVTGNTMSFPNLSYTGTGLFTFPLYIWTGGRTAPLFGTADYLIQLVAGSADELVTTQSGQRWGWLPDGTSVSEIPGSVTATPWGGGTYAGKSIPLLLPASETNPQITINAHGGDYYVHSGQNGLMLQLHAFDSASGDTDHVSLIDDPGGSLESFQFTPQKAASHALPAVGMRVDANKSVVFRWLKVNIPAGKTAGFGGIKGQLGAKFTNLTGAASSHYLLVNGVDGQAGQASQVLFGPVSTPSGAAQTATLLNWPTSTQARMDVDLDRNGTTDQSSTIQGITPVAVKTPGVAKLLPDGTVVSLQRAIATTAQTTFNGYFYCEDPDRSSGIRVVASAGDLASLAYGSDVQVIGTMATSSTGERQIINPLIIISATEKAPDPILMSNQSVGGATLGSLPAGQVGITGIPFGTNNVGLLVTTTGVVTDMSSSTITITDGSGPLEIDRTVVSNPLIEVGSRMTVTGISSIRMENAQRKPVILPRSVADITPW